MQSIVATVAGHQPATFRLVSTDAASSKSKCMYVCMYVCHAFILKLCIKSKHENK